MSFFPGNDPEAGDAFACDAIETLIIPKVSDIGGFEVRRALPSLKRKLVGPFIFFDRMGPATFKPGEAIDVRPHPHIGLSTVTYLYDGTIRHRDSLGTEMVIAPGDINLMTAGRGIVHSERSPEETRDSSRRLSGLQTWLALPDAVEEMAPAFENTAAASVGEHTAPSSTASCQGRPRTENRCTTTSAPLVMSACSAVTAIAYIPVIPAGYKALRG